ncbi:hypothetical protein CLV41_110199 [Roseibium marinum]|uniref:Uncharacterized protein n=1 Tax=Roseibium marinum TaxID=281252 RepID=A0A2S3UNB7_9HYPH|nr:hypothetical protein CLV41_110199 [Roseibium marinum]
MQNAQFKKQGRRKGVPFQDIGTPKWAFCAKSLRDAADFGPDCVGKSLWWAAPLRTFLLFGHRNPARAATQILIVHRPKVTAP